MSDRFKDALTGAWQRIEERQWVFGHLGKLNADSSYTLAVPGRKNFVYVTIRNSGGAQTVVAARNDSMVALEGRIPVKMKLEQGIYVIVGRSARDDLGSPLIPSVNPHTHPVAQVNLNLLGIPTYTTLESFINTTGSKGHATGGVISDAGGATVDVTAGTGYIRATDSETASLLSFNWPAVTGLAIPANTVRYVKIEYNAGTPQVALDTTEDIDEETEFLLGAVVNEAGTLHITHYYEHVTSSSHRTAHTLREVFGIRRAERVGGIVLGETGTRNLTVTAGELYLGRNEFAFAAIDTSGADRFDLYYRDGAGSFTKVADQAQWPNTQYDDGSGTLADLTVNRYSVVWVYAELDGDLAVLYGRGNYVGAANAEAENPPSTIPLRLQNHGVLIGRLIYQKSAATATEIQSAWTRVFNPAQAADHGELSGLSDDDHVQYYNETRGDLRYSQLTHGHALDDISNVDLTGLSDGQGITYDLASTTWKPASIAAGDFIDRDGSRPLTGNWGAGAFNIGIGGAAGPSRLTVLDAYADTPTFNRSPEIALKNTDATNGNYTSINSFNSANNVVAGIDFINVDHAFDGAVAFSTRTSAGVYGRRLYITPDGNVGINTVSPDTLLHVELSNTVYNAPTTLLTLVKRGTVPASNSDGSGPQIVFKAEDIDTNAMPVAAIAGVIQDPNFNNTGRYGDLIFYTAPYDYGALTERMRINGPGNVAIGGVSLNSAALSVYETEGSATAYFINAVAATYTDVSPNGAFNFRSRWTGQGVNWDTARIKWGFADTYSSSGARFGIDVLNSVGDWSKALTFIGGGYAFFHQSPISLTGTGEGTYNRTAIYNDGTYGFLIEVARETDASGGTPRPFTIAPRGGTPTWMKIDSAGDVGFGTNDPQYSMHIVRNQNANTAILLSNSTDGDSAATSLQILEGSSGLSVGKLAPSYPSYKILYSGAGYLYHHTSGHFSILNDYASGDIFMAAQGHSQPDFQVTGATTYIIGQEAADAVLSFAADNGDNNNDYWRFAARERGANTPLFELQNLTDGSWITNLACSHVANVPTGGLYGHWAHTSGSFYFYSLAAGTGTDLVLTASSQLVTKSSSLRYKENIVDSVDGMDLIKQFRPVEFQFIGNKERQVGFIAEEVAALDDRFVSRNSDGLPEGVHYGNMAALFVNALREMDARLSKLEAM